MVSVEYPCPLLWNDLEGASESERFCSECKKRILRNPQNQSGSYCGVDEAGYGWPSDMTSFRVRFLLILVCVFGPALFSMSRAISQTDTIATELSDGAKIRGFLHDSNMEPLMFARVEVKKNDYVIAAGTTDFDGIFKITLPSATTEITLFITYPGFIEKSFTLKIEPGRETDLGKIELKDNQSALTVGIVIPTGPPLIDKDNPNKTTFNRSEINRSAVSRGR